MAGGSSSAASTQRIPSSGRSTATSRSRAVQADVLASMLAPPSHQRPAPTAAPGSTDRFGASTGAGAAPNPLLHSSNHSGSGHATSSSCNAWSTGSMAAASAPPSHRRPAPTADPRFTEGTATNPLLHRQSGGHATDSLRVHPGCRNNNLSYPAVYGGMAPNTASAVAPPTWLPTTVAPGAYLPVSAFPNGFIPGGQGNPRVASFRAGQGNPSTALFPVGQGNTGAAFYPVGEGNSSAASFLDKQGEPGAASFLRGQGNRGEGDIPGGENLGDDKLDQETLKYGSIKTKHELDLEFQYDWEQNLKNPELSELKEVKRLVQRDIFVMKDSAKGIQKTVKKLKKRLGEAIVPSVESLLDDLSNISFDLQEQARDTRPALEILRERRGESILGDYDSSESSLYETD